MTDFFTLEPEAQAARLEAAGHEALANWDISGASLALIKHRENAVFKLEKDEFRAALRLHIL